MDRENIKYERWTADQLKVRYPQFTADTDTIALYQPDGGLVDAALANSTHIQLAMAHGAHVIDCCPVVRIEANPDGTATPSIHLSAIGTLMQVTGLVKRFEEIFGKNAIKHIMTGKSMQRAFRGHLLLEKCLNGMLVSEVMDQDSEFTALVDACEETCTSWWSNQRQWNDRRKAQPVDNFIPSTTSLKEVTEARMKWDQSDLATLGGNPFSAGDPCLSNIITGLVTDDNVNVDD
ncbi:hypothetical protein LSH36_1011g00012 [Paralvinella palmiformis]|uniref:Uncharacterized protein n=1 Tax=Paralvinella palmiformis TaxID=53620 RepID=A0AAD9IVX7_9ANNE|nr:hypothetical protein LSH36_1011g00012 [Paralvinella palmiformis]